MNTSINYIIIYPYKIVTCHNRAYEVSKFTFALTTRSISAGQKSCIAVNTGFLTCYGTFYDVTIRDVSYIIKFNYSRDDLIGDITTPLQTNSSHRASDMAGDHCYFGSFFLYQFKWNYLYHISAWFRLIWYRYIIIRFMPRKRITSQVR